MKEKIQNYLYYISIILVIIWIFYIQNLLWILKFFIFIFFYSLIFYVFYFLWKKFRKKELLKFKDFFVIFFKKISLSIIIIALFLASFWYYQNIISPAKIPEYTISNWKKIVVFQAMSHIWSEKFYQSVKTKLENYKKNWYVYFFEWVKPWTKENNENFNKALWIKFNKEIYKNFSKIYWLTNQDNSIYLWLVNNLDFNVDLNMDEIMFLYDKKFKNKKINFNTSKNKSNKIKEKSTKIIDMNKELINTLAKLNEKELKILRFVNKSILNFLLKSDKTQKLIMDNFSNKKLMNVILIERNKKLTNAIIKSKYNKIFITYWLLHFKWALKLLQKNDKNWKIINTKYLNPIQ